jgi:hypothetical protein
MSAPGPLARTALAPQAPQAELVEAVRHWVHFDNLAESLQKQVTNTRSMRTTFEEKILRFLDAGAMRGATLEITGATLTRAMRPKTTDLSWSFLETSLHEYHKSRGKPDETEAILEFIQSKRDTKQIPYLKKTSK